MNCPHRPSTVDQANYFECTCPKECPRHEKCCACVARHRKMGKLPHYITMACSLDFIDFVCKQIEGAGNVRTRKKFGDYCIYVDEKPIILACDNIVYVKKHKAIEDMMSEAGVCFPYDGAKEHYILDIEHHERALNVIKELFPHIPYPKPKKKKDADITR